MTRVTRTMMVMRLLCFLHCWGQTECESLIEPIDQHARFLDADCGLAPTAIESMHQTEPEPTSLATNPGFPQAFYPKFSTHCVSSHVSTL